MGLLSKLGAFLASIVGIASRPAIRIRSTEELRSDLNKRHATFVVRNDRAALAAAEEKRKRRIERNKNLGVKNPQMIHWMPASKLPMVDTPLLLLIKEEGQDVVYKAERRNWVTPAKKEGDLLFYGDDFEGGTKEGRFPWTYP